MTCPDFRVRTGSEDGLMILLHDTVHIEATPERIWAWLAQEYVLAHGH